MSRPNGHISHLPTELLLQILGIQHDENSRSWGPDSRLESKRLGILRLVSKRFADIGLAVLLDHTVCIQPSDRIMYRMTEQSLACIETNSQNPTLAPLITRLDCPGFVYDHDLMERQLDCSGQCHHRDSMDPELHTEICLYPRSYRLRSLYMAQHRLMSQGQAVERLQRALPRFPNLRKLVRAGLCTPGTRYSTMRSGSVTKPLSVSSSIHGWSGMVDIARVLLSTPSHIDTLELLNVVPDLGTCSHEELAILRSVTRTTPTLHTLSIHPFKLDPLGNFQLLTRVSDIAAEARLWRYTFFAQMASLRSLGVRSYDQPDDDELGDSSVMRSCLRCTSHNSRRYGLPV